MEYLTQAWSVLLHLDAQLAALAQQYGGWIYALLFAIVFCETGLVVTPFLPGDSLLFVAGTLAGAGRLDPLLLASVLVAAAILGNTVNYAIGRWLGPRVFHWEHSRFFNRQALDRAHAFYERHGGKTVVITRFIPILRTFAPFVAGIGRMDYARFAAYNALGALAWVLSLLCAGYWFGNAPLVRENLTAVILAIVALSLAPIAAEYLRQRLRRSSAAPAVKD